MTTPAGALMSAPITCPTCHDERPCALVPPSPGARWAARQSIPPQMIRVCPTCHALLVVTLHPAPEALAT